MIHKRHKNRPVCVAPGHENDVLASIRALSMSCREGILLLEEELALNDPGLNERCGWLDGRFEVFAVAVPGCRGHRLVVSIDHGSGLPPPAVIHSAIRTRQGCQIARCLAVTQLGLINPVWE